MGAVARPTAQRPKGASSPGRRFVVLSYHDDVTMASVSPKKSATVHSFSEIIDSLTSMCLCHHQNYSDSKFKVTYPVAGFDHPLNHIKLVEQRRRSLKHKMFRPVSEDDASMSVNYYIPTRRKSNGN